ncbi:MAG: Mth938-like domain-containing protein [Steroidobacteraceae bacterium]
MKLSLEAGSDIHLIRGYAPDGLKIGARVVRTPCIVSAHTLVTDWNAPSAAALATEHLEPVFALDPQVVIVGTGPTQRLPSAAVREAFAARGIGLEPMDLHAACRTYNVLVQEERRVVALLFSS